MRKPSNLADQLSNFELSVLNTNLDTAKSIPTTLRENELENNKSLDEEYGQG